MRTRSLVAAIASVITLIFVSIWTWLTAYHWYQDVTGEVISYINLRIAGKVFFFGLFAIIFWFLVGLAAVQIGRKTKI